MTMISNKVICGLRRYTPQPICSVCDSFGPVKRVRLSTVIAGCCLLVLSELFPDHYRTLIYNCLGKNLFIKTIHPFYSTYIIEGATGAHPSCHGTLCQGYRLSQVETAIHTITVNLIPCMPLHILPCVPTSSHIPNSTKKGCRLDSNLGPSCREVTPLHPYTPVLAIANAKYVRWTSAS